MLFLKHAFEQTCALLFNSSEMALLKLGCGDSDELLSLASELIIELLSDDDLLCVWQESKAGGDGGIADEFWRCTSTVTIFVSFCLDTKQMLAILSEGFCRVE